VPELPEVESIRRALLPHLLGRTVTAAKLLRRDILVAPGDPVGGFSRQRTGSAKGSPRKRIRPAALRPADLLLGSTITTLDRRGKQLAILARSAGSSSSEPDHAIVIQLGMTGALEIIEPAAKRPTREPHIHALWTLDNGVQLRFRDPRRFGAIRVFRSIRDLNDHWRALGPDALTTTPTNLCVALINTKRPLKAALLDQSIVAGLGNIYVDEALFLAHLHPKDPTRTISWTETRRLWTAIRRVLREAIKAGGSTIRDYVSPDGSPGSYAASHRVYGRAGLPCPVCSTRLSTAVLAQRTTVWCSHCQPRQPRRSP
jgi:formamidopyrimidine-DNA glycosylase